MIVAANVDVEKDYELRMDMLALVEHFLLQKDLHSTIVFYSEIILKMILLPSIQWRAGKPNCSVRKAAIVCSIKLVESQLIEKDKLYENFHAMFKLLKNSMEDDWDNDMRYASVVLMKNILIYVQSLFEHDDY